MRVLQERPPYWASVGAVILGVGCAVFCVGVIVVTHQPLDAVITPARIPIAMPSWLFWSVGFAACALVAGLGVAGIVKRGRAS